MLLDSLHRPLSSLRVSVTDRCNLRCAYCMPEEEYTWTKKSQILTFEEISSLVDAFMRQGVRKVRLTGGEPLVRADLERLVRLLAQKPLEELAMTTNGLLLAEKAEALKDAGLQRVTVSLDTLSPTRFLGLTRRSQHAEVLAGIAEAHRQRFPRPLKLDTVVMRGVNDDELVPLLDFAARFEAELRFIEYMDVGGATRWSMDRVVSRAELIERLTKALGPVEPILENSSAPAERFRLSDGRTFGIIASTTQPFCRTCDRVRLTADGTWLTCLYATQGVDLKTPLRDGASPEALAARIGEVWTRRSDRGAEERLALRESRGPLASARELKDAPNLEMHTRGG
jgi:cyclic pyranopterin phosphate synthase